MPMVLRAGATGIVFTCLLAAAAFGQPARFDGERVVRVTVADESQLATALELTDDVWSHEIGVGPIDMRVNATQFAALQATGLPFEVLIQDLQEKVEAERFSIEAGGGFFDAYHRYEDVNAYLNTLAGLRPDLAQVITIGTSVQGRSLVAIRITGPGDSTNRPEILFHGGQHAREWITVPVTTYVADQLIRNYDTDPYMQRLVDRCVFYILPIMNPDGYVYTWDSNRMWRKNRRNNGGSFGVDLNRNWGWQWGGAGASSSPSSDTYRGPSAFSEPETQALRDFILAHPNIVAYNDIHSYSQLILWPWGYTSALPADQDEFARIGFGMEERIEALYGTDFVAGPIYSTIYAASGGSTDWAYGAAGILAFSYELRDTGASGFVLPPSQIMPSCLETLPALLFYADTTSAPIRLELAAAPPDIVAPQTPAPIGVRIVENLGALEAGTALLRYRVGNSGPFASVELLSAGGNLFSAELPGVSCGADVQYYVEAQSTTGETLRLPENAPEATFVAQVGELIEVFREDFESPAEGWTVTNTSLSSGMWERVVPVGTLMNGQPFAPGTDHTPGKGMFCWVTQNGPPGGAVGGADVDGGPTVLTSPDFPVADYQDPRIGYARWMAATDSDTMTVEVSADGGPWQVLEVVSDERAWVTPKFRLADVFGGANISTVRIRFSIADQPNNSTTEGAVDDLVIEELVCKGLKVLPGDMNCDGVVSVADIGPFVMALTDPAGYIAAYPTCSLLNGDFTADGQLTVGDIGAFVSALTGG
jgi:carboxypeptidase A4